MGGLHVYPSSRNYLILWPKIDKNLQLKEVIEYAISFQYLIIFTVFPVKPWIPEKISGMLIVSRAIRYEMKPQKITAKPQHWLATTRCETTSWLFLLREIFNFTVLEYWNFSFCDFSFDRIDMNDILRKSDANQEDRISRSDTARQCIWEREKKSQSQAMFLCLFHVQFKRSC